MVPMPLGRTCSKAGKSRALGYLLQHLPVPFRAGFWYLIAYLHEHVSLDEDVWASSRWHTLIVVVHGGQRLLGPEDEDYPPTLSPFWLPFTGRGSASLAALVLVIIPAR